MFDCTTSGHFDFTQAVNAIAATLYPKEEKKPARTKVRNRIKRAADAGEIRIIRLNDQKLLEAEPFLSWALDTWPQLPNALSLIPAHISGLCEIKLAGISATGELHSLPIAEDQLKQQHIRLLSERSVLYSEKEKANEQLIDTQTELEVFKAKDALMRQIASEAGKQGGRGNEK